MQVESNDLSLCLYHRLSVGLSVRVAEQQHDCMFSGSTSRSIMEVKERRPYCSLSKCRKDQEGPYAGELSELHSFAFSRSCLQCIYWNGPHWSVKIMAAYNILLTLHENYASNLRAGIRPFRRGGLYSRPQSD